MTNVKTLLLILSLSMISCANKAKAKVKKQNAPAQPTPAAQPPVQVATYAPADAPYFVKAGIACTTQNCPYPSICSDAATCMCGYGLANYPFEGQNCVYCQYEQKKQLVGFLLELLLNMGIGHLVCGRIAMGVVKLVCVLLPCVLGCLQICQVMTKGQNSYVDCLVFTSWGLGCATSVWWLVDAM